MTFPVPRIVSPKHDDAMVPFNGKGSSMTHDVVSDVHPPENSQRLNDLTSSTKKYLTKDFFANIDDQKHPTKKRKRQKKTYGDRKGN